MFSSPFGLSHETSVQCRKFDLPPLRAIEHDMILDIRCRGEDGGIVFISYFIVLLYIRVHCLEIVVFVLSHFFFIISLNTGVDI